MKKFLLSFLMLFAVGTFIAGAQTVVFEETFNKNTAKGGNDGIWGSISGTSYDPVFDQQGWETSENRVYGANACIRFNSSDYKDGSVTTPALSVEGNATLTFKAGGWKKANCTVNLATTSGTLSQSAIKIENEKWTDYTVEISGATSGMKITFSGTDRFFLDEVKVTVSGEVQVTAAPTFSPAAGTYYEAQSVTLSAEDGASIYYTINGDEPTAQSTLYSTPIEVAQTTTIKAIAVKDGVSSAVASATYTIVTATKVASIAEMLEQEDGTLVEFSNPVTAIFQDGNYMFVKDATGVTQFYGKVETQYENGDVIPAGVKGTFVMYNDVVPQLTVWDTADSFAESTENTGEVDPTKYAVADVTNDLANQYVVIENVTITSEQSGDYTNYYAKSGNDKVMIYARFSTFTNEQLAALEAGKEYNVAGFVTIFKGAPEIYIVSVTDPEGGDTPDPDPVDGVFFSTDFEDNDGGFTFQDITLPAGGSYVWKYDSKYGYWKGTAFISGTNYAAESWLVSPEIDLTKAKKAELVFDGLAKYLGGNPMSDYFKVKISIDYTKDVKAATWTEVTVNGIEESTDGWNFYTVTPIDLGGYIGKKIRIAFQYISTDSNAPTFEIDNLSVKGEETSGVVGVAAEGAVKVLGLDGEIAIVGEAADVEVYNMGGALIAKGNLERISCPQGIYVVKVDGNVQKVIVK